MSGLTEGEALREDVERKVERTRFVCQDGRIILVRYARVNVDMIQIRFDVILSVHHQSYLVSMRDSSRSLAAHNIRCDSVNVGVKLGSITIGSDIVPFQEIILSSVIISIIIRQGENDLSISYKISISGTDQVPQFRQVVVTLRPYSLAEKMT